MQSTDAIIKMKIFKEIYLRLFISYRKLDRIYRFSVNDPNIDPDITEDKKVKTATEFFEVINELSEWVETGLNMNIFTFDDDGFIEPLTELIKDIESHEKLFSKYEIERCKSESIEKLKITSKKYEEHIFQLIKDSEDFQKEEI